MTILKNNSNYNKRQFWSYKKLNEKTNKHKSKLDTKKQLYKSKKQFHIINEKVITDKDLIKRIESIYIPPAYKDLVISKSENNKIQAIGTDARGRRQYIYNTKYTKKRNERKYDDVMELGKSILKIEKDNEYMLNKLTNKKYEEWDLPNDYIPIIIYMLKLYHFRIGNECYAKDNKSYGITTLKKKHIHFLANNKFKIEFIGKKSIVNSYTDDNILISKLLKKLIENASEDDFLFKYNHINQHNNKKIHQLITPEHIQSFFQDNYNAYITPKMFRTWYGNHHIINYLQQLFKEHKLKKRMVKNEVRELINKCSEHVSNKLNNTPSVTKKSYIDNKILDLIIKNPYDFSKKIPDTIEEQHKFLYKIILKLRH